MNHKPIGQVVLPASLVPLLFKAYVAEHFSPKAK